MQHPEDLRTARARFTTPRLRRHDQRRVQFSAVPNPRHGKRLPGDAQFAAVVVEVQTAGHHTVSTLTAFGRRDGNGFQRVFLPLPTRQTALRRYPSRMAFATSPASASAGSDAGFDHGIQHLGRSDNDFTCADTFFDDHFRAKITSSTGIQRPYRHA